MSTLAVDFETPTEHALRHWLFNRYEHRNDPARVQQAELDCLLALEADPHMLEWADFPAVLHKGEWLREKAARAATLFGGEVITIRRWRPL